jgi:hypothetical protein
MKYQKGGCLLKTKEVIRFLPFSKDNRIDGNAFWTCQKNVFVPNEGSAI